MDALDWSVLPLGPPKTWPQSLRSVVDLLLASKFPMFVAWGDELGFLYNDSYAEILGDKHPHALGRRFFDIWPEIWDDILPLIDTAMAGEAIYRENLPLTMNRHGHDEDTWFTFSYSPVRGEDGEVAGIFCAVVETTAIVLEERRKEALLRLDEALRDTATPAALSFVASEILGETLGVSRVGYGSIDADAGTIVVERNWFASGFDDLAGIHHFADYGSYIDDLRRGLAVANADVEADPRTALHAGAFRALGIRAHLDVPVIENGQAVGQLFVHSPIARTWSRHEIALVRDFAERTRAMVARRQAEVARISAERALDVSEESLRLAVAAAEIGTWDLDVLRDVLVWNGQTKAAFGISADASISMVDFYSGLHPDDFDATSTAFATALDPAQRETYDVEYRTIGKEDGVVRWVSAKGSGLFDDQGRCVRALGTAIDITERKRAEESLRSLNETLEHRVAERAAELEAAQEQLRQSQKMEAMGSLTGGVAHDFNNLLTPIVGALDMLQRSGLGGEREQRLIAGAIQSADRAKTLVQRLLAFARRQPLQATGVDLVPLVRGMAGLVSSTTGPQIKVVVEAADNLPPAKADANQVEMAILNLAVNARDAMPEGGVLRITLDTETVGRQHRANVEPGGYLVLSVADTGSGMDEATLSRAVEPFFSTKGIGKGTGLGLSMAHGLASQLGGALAISSTPGVGTNIEIWLPQSAEPPVKAGPTADSVQMTKSSGTVLLVDDEDTVRLSTADMLLELGYTVVEAASAEEAVKLIDRGLTPDLLVTDHLMPGMSGTELARTFQSNRPRTKVLIMSGYADAGGIAPDLPRLTKPFRRADLAVSLASLD